MMVLWSAELKESAVQWLCLGLHGSFRPCDLSQVKEIQVILIGDFEVVCLHDAGCICKPGVLNLPEPVTQVWADIYALPI